MSAKDRSRGVVATSSGNHAQGVSRAAKELGIDAVIVMPTDAPKVKVAGVLNDGADNTKIYGAEPKDYNDHQQSLKQGHRVELTDMPPTLCDALMTPTPGALTWPINSQSLSGVFTVSDTDCLMAMAIAKRELGVQLEPGGAVAIAALLKGALANESDLDVICIILSGGNVDPDVALRANRLLEHSK